jgi:hypothetical protein
VLTRIVIPPALGEAAGEFLTAESKAAEGPTVPQFDHQPIEQCFAGEAGLPIGQPRRRSAADLPSRAAALTNMKPAS